MTKKSTLNDIHVVATTQLLEALGDSERRMRQRLDLISEVVFELSSLQRIVFLNRAWKDVSGIAAEEMIGLSLTDYLLPQDQSDFKNAIRVANDSPSTGGTTVRLAHINGTVSVLELSVVAIATGYVGTLHDITAHKQAMDQLKYTAHFDILTKLPNRSLLIDRIERGIASCKRHKRMMLVAFLDLDGFKAINDSHGHDVGDHLLVSISQRLQTALRLGDSIARIGGDEFVIVLMDLERVEQGYPILDRLLQVSSDAVVLNGANLRVSASIGVTAYPGDKVDAEDLIRHADQAMYSVKKSGKNRYHFYDFLNFGAKKSTIQSIERLQIALEKSEFVLHFQPKLNLQSKRIYGAEALIRWQHPNIGLLPPAEFLPNIENRQICLKVGEWVIATALKQLGQWAREGSNLVLSVNISAFELQHRNFVTNVRRLLSEHPLPKLGALIFEIPEKSALENTVHVSKVIQECKDVGVGFAIDDFGTGYSSLTYLRQLPAETLKIDRSFVQNMLTSRDDLAVVKSVVGLAKAFRKNVIAEGVETTAHMAKLAKLGCHCMQGFAIAPGMPSAEFQIWLHDYSMDFGRAELLPSKLSLPSPPKSIDEI